MLTAAGPMPAVAVSAAAAAARPTDVVTAGASPLPDLLLRRPAPGGTSRSTPPSVQYRWQVCGQGWQEQRAAPVEEQAQGGQLWLVSIPATEPLAGVLPSGGSLPIRLTLQKYLGCLML